MPVAYSYVRFSTPEQAKGDSLRRQIELSRSYAKENGLTLDEALTFTDPGLSAFRGRNRKEGALGVFIAAVKSGRVQPGSYLLVESLDRLSRDTVRRAWQLLSEIIDLGVNVVTLSDRRVYSKETVDTNFADLLVSLTVMYRAHEESLTKSRRIRAAWMHKKKQARENGHALTSMTPAWVEPKKEADGRITYRLIPGRVAVLRRIFRMLLDGIGKEGIVKRLNAEKVPSFGKRGEGWHTSYLGKLLNNPAVYGAYQPRRNVYDEHAGRIRREPDGDLIENYFPAALDKETFLRARRIVEERRIPPGPRTDREGKETIANLFSGLLKCGGCGASMILTSKGRGTRKLVCNNARRGKCTHAPHWWHYRAVEGFVVLGLKDVNWASLYPSIYESAAEASKKLEDALLVKQESLSKLDTALETVIVLLVERPDSEALKAKLDKLEREKTDTKQRIREISEALTLEKAKLADAQQAAKTAEDALRRWFAGDNKSPEGRMKMSAVIRNAVSVIRLHPTIQGLSGNWLDPEGRYFGMIEVEFRDTDQRQHIPVWWDQTEAFLGRRARNGREMMWHSVRIDLGLQRQKRVRLSA